jgi:predicted nucleic acid-binding protein
VKTFFDTSVLVAACVEEHEHHGRALTAVQLVYQGKVEGYVSVHSILEVYSVLTHLPRSPRIMPLQASALVEENILKRFSVLALTAKEYGDLVRRLGRDGTAGGQAYDALQIECAGKCQAERIYTFNVRHFSGVAAHLAAKVIAP